MEKFSVKKPFTVLVAVIMVLMLGFVSISNMQTNLLPDVNTPYAQGLFLKCVNYN